MTNVTTTEALNKVIANSWDELGLVSGSSSSEIIDAFRILCLKYALSNSFDPVQTESNKDNTTQEFQMKALAYRFLCNIPISQKVYSSHDYLPTLRPLEIIVYDKCQSESSPLSLSQKQLANLRNSKACAMLDLSIVRLERAQSTLQLPYTNYVISVHYCLRKHIVRRRYSEFLALHSSLQSKLPVIPEFPQKSWYDKFSLSSELALDLLQYLTRVVALLSHRGLFSMDIMSFLEVDYDRIRKEEEGLAAKHLNHSSLPNNSILYLINSQWIIKWHKFINGGSNEFPGKIDNSILFENGAPKKHLYVARDYRFLNERVWKFLTLIYRGGPEVTRKANTIYSVKTFDKCSAAINIQRIIRGYISRQHAASLRETINVFNPEVQRRVEMLWEFNSNKMVIEKIKLLVQSKEDCIRQRASEKIQKACCKFLASKRMKSKELNSYKIMEEVLWSPQDHFPLSEVGKILDNDQRLAQFLHTMRKGVILMKGGSRFQRSKRFLFKLNENGSRLEWTSDTIKKSQNYILLIEISSVTSGDESNSAGERYAVCINTKNEKNPLVLLCDNIYEKEALHFGLEKLCEEGKKSIQDCAYIDSYGMLRKKQPHAKKLIREANRLLGAATRIEDGG